MSSKSVSLSVRLSSDDSSFLAAYNTPGATSLSEKVRALIAEARQRQVGNENYADALRLTDGLIGPSMRRMREIETAHNIHSEMLLTLGHWFPDAVAALISGVPASKDPASKGNESAEKLKTLEAVMADRVFALIEQVLRLGVTGESPCYDPAVVVNRASTVAILSQLIKDTHNQKQG